MSKIVNISEKKFMKALRHIVTEEAPSNYDPFADQIADKKKFSRLGTPYEGNQDGHGESTVGEPVDPTVYDKNAPDSIVNK
jgi:hypothetical protein